MSPSKSSKFKDQSEHDSSNSNTSHLNNDSDDFAAHRQLSAFDLVMFGIGNTIGAGIFALTGIAA